MAFMKLTEAAVLVARETGRAFGDVVISLVEHSPALARRMLAGENDPVIEVGGERAFTLRPGVPETASQEAMRRAEERVASGQAGDLSSALSAIFQADPGLYQRYRAEVGGAALRPAGSVPASTNSLERAIAKVAADENLAYAEAAQKVMSDRATYEEYRRQASVGPNIRRGTESATAQAMAKAERIATQENVSLQDAIARVFGEDAELYRRYRDENNVKI